MGIGLGFCCCNKNICFIDQCNGRVETRPRPKSFPFVIGENWNIYNLNSPQDYAIGNVLTGVLQPNAPTRPRQFVRNIQFVPCACQPTTNGPYNFAYNPMIIGNGGIRERNNPASNDLSSIPEYHTEYSGTSSAHHPKGNLIAAGTAFQPGWIDRIDMSASATMNYFKLQNPPFQGNPPFTNVASIILGLTNRVLFVGLVDRTLSTFTDLRVGDKETSFGFSTEFSDFSGSLSASDVYTYDASRHVLIRTTTYNASATVTGDSEGVLSLSDSGTIVTEIPNFCEIGTSIQVYHNPHSDSLNDTSWTQSNGTNTLQIDFTQESAIKPFPEPCG